MANEYLSGNTFFEKVRANHGSLSSSLAPPGAMAPLPSDPSSKGSQDKIIDQAKRRWPNMPESQIIEGLNKVKHFFLFSY
jgi:hypothetical protein